MSPLGPECWIELVPQQRHDNPLPRPDSGVSKSVEAAKAMVKPGNPAGHVFISYVREDSFQVDQLQRTLQAAGIPVWRDTADLWPGEDWRAKIRRAIVENALVFIACFSCTSLARDRSYQNEELTLAAEQMRLRRPDRPWLIPVRFDECDIPEWDMGRGRTLTSIQRADLFGEQSSEGAARLGAIVLRILGQQTDVGPDVKVATNEPDLTVKRIVDLRNAEPDSAVHIALNEVAGWGPEMTVELEQKLLNAELREEARQLVRRMARRSPSDVAEIIRGLHVRDLRGAVDNVIEHAGERPHDDISMICTALQDINYGEAAERLMIYATRRLGSRERRKLAVILFSNRNIADATYVEEKIEDQVKDKMEALDPEGNDSQGGDPSGKLA